MYNYTRSVLNSVRNHKFFTQLICKRITAYNDAHCTNISWLWNNFDTTCKRFYCQVAVQDVNANVNIKKEQQQLNEFISNPDNKKIFQILELEIDVMRHNAEKVPKHMKPREWLELLNLPSRGQRKKYLSYLFCNEMSRENKKKKAEEEKAKWQAMLAQQKEEEDSGEIKYDLKHNSLFLRIFDQNMIAYYNLKLIMNMRFEPNLVFDCGYDEHMTRRENHNCARQLTFAFAANRIHNRSLSIYFCNLREEGLLREYLCRNVPTLLNVDFPAVVTSQSYLDLFPKDQLIYLTPHCKTDLVEYDPNMVYIIGAMVDKMNPRPLSLAKAKKEGLRMAKLPIEKYLDWGSSSTKSFTLNQVTSIMLDLRHTKNWEQAFRHIPTRKLKPARENMLKKKCYFASKILAKMESERDKISDKIQTSTKPQIPTNYTFDFRKKE